MTFSLCPRVEASAHGLSVLSLPTAVLSVGVGGSLQYHVSASLAILSVFFLCVNSSVGPQFFRKNWSINNSKVGVFMEVSSWPS